MCEERAELRWALWPRYQCSSLLARLTESSCCLEIVSHHHQNITPPRETTREIYRLHISSSHSSGKKGKREAGRKELTMNFSSKGRQMSARWKSLEPRACSPKKSCKEQNNQNMQIYNSACKQKNKSFEIMGKKRINLYKCFFLKQEHLRMCFRNILLSHIWVEMDNELRFDVLGMRFFMDVISLGAAWHVLHLEYL